MEAIIVKRNITVIAFVFFMSLVSIFSVIILNMSGGTKSVMPAETVSTVIQTAADTTAVTTAASATAVSYVPKFPMDINDADMDALLAVTGIGEVTANKILEYKRSVGTVSSMDMLLEIDGIGEKTLSALKDYFYVSAIYTVVTTTEATTAIQTEAPPAPTATHSITVLTTTASITPFTTTAQPSRTAVNINTADADELMHCLLITEEQAQDIVALREIIGGYVNVLEILYCETISDGLYVEIEPYLAV